MALHRVFSPLKIGGIELPNRIARTAHGIGLARSDMTEDMIVHVGASQARDTINEQLACTMVDALCGEGLVDYVNASWGDYYKFDTMIGGMHHPLGYELPSATQLPAHANVPRLVTGRVRTLEEAESLLLNNVADIISMVRAMIADPMLIAKTRAGHPKQVHPCIACNQGCVGGMARIGRLGYAFNASAGYEKLAKSRL